MSPEAKFMLTIVLCSLSLIVTLLIIHNRHARLIQELAHRLDEAEKNQTRALGEWSKGMSQHISDSIAGLANSNKALQGQHQEHSKSIADRHEELTKTLHRQMEIQANAAAAKHDEAIIALGEHHRRNLEKLAERNEISNKELARQYSEVIATLKDTIHELDARMEKNDSTAKELGKSLVALRDTLADAVKL